MRSYALLIFTLTVLNARAASIPAPTEAGKLPNENEALDNVSLDNNVSEQKLSDRPNIIKEDENDIPTENVPVEIIEEKPVLKTIALKEDSNDYVPDNDDSANIKRVEIDLNNPGPPQRQEHDSQNPVNYVDKERAVAIVQKSIAESQNIFDRALQDITHVFQDYASNKKNLEAVQTNIQTLKQNVNVQVTKLSDTVNSYLNPEGGKIIEDADVSRIKEVKNSLRSLRDKINTGMDMLSQGADVLAILKEEDETNLPDKISGKADNVNVASTATGVQPTSPAPVSSTVPPNNILENVMNSMQTAIQNALTSVTDMFQNFVNSNQNQNQNQNQNPQGTAPAGTQSDQPASSTQSPNFFQYLQTLMPFQQNNQQQTQQTQNQNPPFYLPNGPIATWISTVFPQRPQQNNQQTAQTTNVNQPSSPPADQPVQPVQTAPAPAQGSNSVPVAPAPQPATQPQQNPPVQGPIQQIVQNNPIVKGITNAVQRIQGLSNPSTPRDEPKPPSVESSDAKGHGPSAANGSNSINSGSGLDTSVISAPTKAEPETISEIKNEVKESVAEPNKTE